YELSGDTAWSFAEYAAELSRQTGKEIRYNAVPVEEFTAILTGPAGVPEAFATILAGVEVAVQKGELAGTPGDLSRLIGRATTPIADASAAAAQGGRTVP